MDLECIYGIVLTMLVDCDLSMELVHMALQVDTLCYLKGTKERVRTLDDGCYPPYSI